MTKGIRNIWIDSDTPESIGNKVIRDGVEIADVLNGVQKYDDPDVVVNRQYKYVIQSYTATGQSTDEVLGDNLNYYTIVEAGDLTPIMTNFRVNEATPTHIHFDAPLGPVTGLTTQGFTVSGKTVTGIDTTLGYITVDSAFDFWDNNTIRLESGNGVVIDFTMEYIINNTNEPTSTLPKYVAVGGSGNGSSEGAPMSITAAFSEANANTIYWIKKGNYGNVTLTVGGSGDVDAPAQFKGYDTLIGDLDDDYIIDSFTYTNPANAATYFDPTKWPLITGVNSGDSDRGMFISAKSNIIIKNIQIQKFSYCFWVYNGSYNIIMENCTSGLSYWGNGDGLGFFSGSHDINRNWRTKKCLSIDDAGAGFRTYGQYNAFVECKTYTGIDTDASMDYHFSMQQASNNIVYKCEANRTDEIQHGCHGFGIKSGGYDEVCEYNLFQKNKAYGMQNEVFFAAHAEVRFNVWKENYSYTTWTSVSYHPGMVARNGAHDNIFEYNYLEGTMYAIYMYTNTEQQPISHGAVAYNNIFRNNILKDAKYAVCNSNIAGEGNYDIYNNKIYNNTFYLRNLSSCRVFLDSSASPNDLNFSGNEFKNNNIYCQYDNTPLYGDQSVASNYLMEYNNFFRTSAIGVGTGNQAVDPQFNNTNEGGFIPTAPLDTIDAPRIVGAEYDIYENERAAVTTIGAVKNTNEV